MARFRRVMFKWARGILDMRTTTLLACCTIVLPIAWANTQKFEGIKLAANDAKEIPVTLAVASSGLTIQHEPPLWGKPDPNGLKIEIAYSAVTRLSYGFTNHKRALEALAGGLAALAVTSPLRHWLLIECTSPNVPPKLLLRLNPRHYREVISELNESSGRHVELLDPKSTDLDPTAGSKDVETVVAAQPAQVMAAVRRGMESVACKITNDKGGFLRCRRHHVNTDRTGLGGEEITAEVSAESDGTRVRIVTPHSPGRGRNWSTPVYREMRKQL